MDRTLISPANFPAAPSALMPVLSRAWTLAGDWMFAMGVRLADQDKPLALKMLVEVALISHALWTWMMAPQAAPARTKHPRRQQARARRAGPATTRRLPAIERVKKLPRLPAYSPILRCSHTISQNAMTLATASEHYLEQCRQAMNAELAASLAQTAQWAHLDKAKIHQDWDLLYQELAPLLDSELPTSPRIQTLMQRHHEIVSRFYAPSRDAYVGMALFYRDNSDMAAFHQAYHPNMVAFLGEAIYRYAHANLTGTAG
ncbi:MAG: TipAS antibiotic-recognition domain-containing protein [Massilia sp.]